MKKLPSWPMPAWMADLPDVERERARVRFLLCLATIYYQDKGNSAHLSEALGVSPNQINVMKTRGLVSGEIAVAVEKLLGRDLFPRELFRPDLFIITE